MLPCAPAAASGWVVETDPRVCLRFPSLVHPLTLLPKTQIERERAKKRAVELGLQEIDRVKPMPDPQDTGLIKGRAAAKAAADAAVAASAGQGDAAPDGTRPGQQ